MKRFLAASFLATAIAYPVFAQEDGYALDCDNYPQSDFAAAWNASERQDRVLRGNPERYKTYDAFVRDFWGVLDQDKVRPAVTFADVREDRFDAIPTVADFLDAVQHAFLKAWDKADGMRAFGGHAALAISLPPKISSESYEVFDQAAADDAYTRQEVAFYPEDLHEAPLKEQPYMQEFLKLVTMDGWNIRIRIHRGDKPQANNFYYISIAQNLNMYRETALDDPIGALLGDVAKTPPPFNPGFHGVSLAGVICRALKNNRL